MKRHVACPDIKRGATSRSRPEVQSDCLLRQRGTTLDRCARGFRGTNGILPTQARVPSIFSTTPRFALDRRALPITQANACVNGVEHMNRKLRGHPRVLSRDQIQQVLRWHAHAIRFRKRQGTLAGFAKSLNLSVLQLERVLRGEGAELPLTVRQRRKIARWGAERRRFVAGHPTARALAESLGVSRSTVFHCISKQGSYKTAWQPPAGALAREGAKGSRINHSKLLRAWRRVAAGDESAPEELDRVPVKRGTP
jgi:hypothetical protein